MIGSEAGRVPNLDSSTNSNVRPQTELLFNKQSFLEQNLYYEEEGQADAKGGLRVNESSELEQAGEA